jgi:two-component system response regulator (stage 0 sporulation protein F)
MNHPITILYIDDEPINLMLFDINFKRDYNVITAATGNEGLEKLRSFHNIKVVVSDMNMPGMNGIEFIIKAKADHPQNIYYILTGYDITKEIADALNDKIILNYFRKPFNIKEIKASIEKDLIL